MGTLDEVKDGIVGVYNQIEGNIGERTTAAIGGAVIGSVIAGTVIGGVIAAKGSNSRTSKKSRKRIKHTKRGWKQDRKRFNKRQKWEVAYRKKKHKKGATGRKKGIHYTKNGQPYILLKSGKARFIKGRRRG